ncbi:MAG: hypothetical protein WC719_04665 [Patescibacteria group bacterium]|jgi:hypothetical protein
MKIEGNVAEAKTNFHGPDDMVAIRKKIEEDVEYELNGTDPTKPYRPGTLRDSKGDYIDTFYKMVEARMADPAEIEKVRDYFAAKNSPLANRN